jgi:hypothetical protein
MMAWIVFGSGQDGVEKESDKAVEEYLWMTEQIAVLGG